MLTHKNLVSNKLLVQISPFLYVFLHNKEYCRFFHSREEEKTKKIFQNFSVKKFESQILYKTYSFLFSNKNFINTAANKAILKTSVTMAHRSSVGES